MRALLLALYLAGCASDDAAPEEEVCACPDDACRDAWIRDHLGCDLCVVLECADGEIHACVACEPSRTVSGSE